MISKTFASKFKPTFRSCDLALFTDSPCQKTHLKLLFKYPPFLKYKPKQCERSHTKVSEYDALGSQTVELKEKDKETIKQEWKEQFAQSKGSVEFNDNLVIQKVNEAITKKFLAELDDESNETRMIRCMDFNSLIKVSEKEANGSIQLKPVENGHNSMIIDYDIEKQAEKRKITESLGPYISIVMKNVHMERGNQLEPVIIEHLNKTEKFKFVQDKELKKADFDLFNICGVVDGIDYERSILVEVKTRKLIDKTKKSICKRERIQCLCYMRLTNCKTCLLVESGPSGEQNIFKIAWDEDEFTTEVLDKLSDFVMKYREMSEQEFSLIAKKYKYDQI